MSQNHSVTKRNRRPKNKRRKDYTATTTAALKELEKRGQLTITIHPSGDGDTRRKDYRLTRPAGI
jgi:hypothetical protein